MLLDSVFIRFYKSFNYDYNRKNIRHEVHARAWEMIGTQFYPFVEVPIDPAITAVVGANESGKSHLLSAIEKSLTIIASEPNESLELQERLQIKREDFCRYSSFFASTQDSRTYPDFGFKWSHLDPEDMRCLRAVWPKVPVNGDAPIYYFRFDGNQHMLYAGPDDQSFPVPDEAHEAFQEWLPRVFRIESDIALPDSVSIQRLLIGPYKPNDAWEDTGRLYSYQLLEAAPSVRDAVGQVTSLRPANRQSQPSLSETLLQIFTGLKPKVEPPKDVFREEERRRKIAEFNLAYDLLFQIARIKQIDVQLLHDSLRKGRTGVVRSVVDKINEALRQKLNFAKVWTQDRDFDLQVEATDHELNFLITDRTGCHYSFDERSSGLKHFLSYYVQYLRYNAKQHNEILMMDEPDAFLSGEAQQDLLKVFKLFVDPKNPKRAGRGPLQVIYVTHSPFLIDKNHSERVRALEKGEGWRGTRVVKGAAKNHYEPLRSAFGAFVGETTFISGCNLITEGPGDQILLAGASSHLRRQPKVAESETLDLNRLTIVPSGGAQTVPYFVYLARGRGGDKPAVVVLLDSDAAGNDAKKKIVTKRGNHPEGKALLPEGLVVQIGDITRRDLLGEESAANAPSAPNAESVPDTTGALANAEQRPYIELEDLVPLPIAARAAASFMQTVFGWTDQELTDISEDKIAETARARGECPFFAVNRLLRAAMAPEQEDGEASALLPNGREATQGGKDAKLSEKDLILGKVAFARTVVDLLPVLEQEKADAGEGGAGVAQRNGLEEFERTMRALFRLLRERQADAERNRGEKQMRDRIDLRAQTFLSDFKELGGAPRFEGERMLKEIEHEFLGGDPDEVAFIQQVVLLMRKHFELLQTPAEPIRDFDTFLAGVETMRAARERIEGKVPANAFLGNFKVPVAASTSSAQRASVVTEASAAPLRSSATKASAEPVINGVAVPAEVTEIPDSARDLQPAASKDEVAEKGTASDNTSLPLEPPLNSADATNGSTNGVS